ncbi:ABC transporter ATP-binding protein [Paenibacillus thermoaerophilus]|uniref:ABC transporter ATP-binding protein n=1 Tax=Paenibacillus thermoaerophilus TaxID=1215385 RepID=A0ABW2V510_9BACL|nr:ABC transporter ATP-binding protein [Paenibacillus thermoaerophilus]TMV18833.1 ABC transporter ATP-binding protein [Paenibacillus thermoaerophilus]
MKFMAPYIQKHGKPFLGAVFFVLIEALCDLFQPTIMAFIIDRGIAEQRMDVVLKLGGLMLLVTAVGAASAASRNLIASRVSQRFGAELRSDLFKHIQSLGFANIDRFERASLVTRLTNDVTQVQNFVNGLMRIFVKAPMLGVGSLIMAVSLSPKLSIVPAVIVPIVALLVALNMKLGFPRFLSVQQALDRLNGVMREYLSGVRVVRAFNRHDYEVEKFARANDEFTGRSVAVARVMALFNPATVLTVNLGILAVLGFGGLGVDRGAMQVGHIVAFINYMTQILFALMVVSMVVNMFVRARASAARIGEVFAERDAMSAGQAEEVRERAGERGRIDFEDVTFSYAGSPGEPVLRRIHLTVLPGETVGIIGSTGSGKSTLIGLIPRLYDAVSGTVKVNGIDVRRIRPSLLRERIAIVPQKSVLFTGTIADNIRWGRDEATREEIEQAAKMAEAHSFITALPEGYETRIGQRGVNLSGGQKQRISIARALVRRPDILVLDDSTSAVDALTEARIKESIRTYARGITCILIAQRISSIMDADKIVVMDRGSVVGVGTHESLLGNCAVYREIYRSQMGKEAIGDVRTR